MAEEEPIGFNPVFDWLAEDRSLTSTEKIIISHILRWGKRGCYESRGTFASAIGKDERTLDRAIKKLYAEEWVTIDYNTKPLTYWIASERLKGKAVFAGLKGCGKPVSFGVKSLQIRQNRGGRFGVIGGRFVALGGAFCRLFYRKRGDLSYKHYREKRVRDKISKAISEKREKKRGKPTAEQFEEQRQKLIEQVEGLK